jgi:hypothetical protein
MISSAVIGLMATLAGIGSAASADLTGKLDRRLLVAQP